jgi:hypothetical protein
MKKVNSAGESPYRGKNIPPLQRQVAELGRRVWEVLEEIRVLELKEEEFINMIKKMVKAFRRTKLAKELFE